MYKRYSFKIIRQIIFDILIVFSSFVISFFLRGQLNFGGSGGLFSQYSNFIVWYVTVIIIVKVLMFWLFGMYRRVWKYASLKDLTAIVEAVTLSSIIAIVIFYITSHPISMFGVKINFSLPYFPRSIFVIDYLLTLILVMVSRFSERFFNELKFGNPDTRKKRTLIVGAGDAGEMIVRE